MGIAGRVRHSVPRDPLPRPGPRLQAHSDLLGLDWKQRQAALAAVKVGIEETLDECLPDVYDRALFARKSAAVFEHVFVAHEGGGRSIYGQANGQKPRGARQRPSSPPICCSLWATFAGCA